MRARLKQHPDSRCAAVSEVACDAERRGYELRLRYRIRGEIGRVSLPPAEPSVRNGDLWRHTCFEAFVRALPREAYCEFNFSPSTEWAAYRFESYRKARRDLEIAEPCIETCSGPALFELRAAVRLSCEGAWELGLTAIIEETNGNLSYWSLAHSPGRPDFHRAANFLLTL